MYAVLVDLGLISCLPYFKAQTAAYETNFPFELLLFRTAHYFWVHNALSRMNSAHTIVYT